MVTDHFPLELGTKEIKEREDGERGGAIIRGRRLIEGRLLFKEIRYTRRTFVGHYFSVELESEARKTN